MIETILLNYLTAKLSVPVYMEVPETDSGSFVVLEKTGGSELNHVSSATVIAQSYGDSLANAAALNELVVSALRQATELPTIGGAHVNSDGVNFTNPNKKRYRYQCAFDFYYVRGE